MIGRWTGTPISMGSLRPVWPRAVDWPQALVTLAACFMLLRRGNQQWYWISLPLLLPAIRAAFSASYREFLVDWLQQLWLSAADFSTAQGPLPWRASLVFVALPSSLLFLSNGRTLTCGDTWPVVPTACQLTITGSVDLAPCLDRTPPCYFRDGESLPYCTLARQGAVYSNYPAGMVPFALPLTGLAQLTGARLDRPGTGLRLEKWTATMVASLSLAMFFLIALHLAPPAPALLTTTLLAVGSVMTSTASQALWQHGGVIFWSLVILLAEFRQRERPRAIHAALQGIACAMMLACRLSSIVFLGPFFGWLLMRRPRHTLLLAAIAVTAYLPWALAYASIYGNIFGPATAQLEGSWWAGVSGDSLHGLLASPGRGLFVYQPWLALAAFAWIPARKETAPRGWRSFCLTVLALQISLVAMWRIWWGGHCWGSRLLADAIPLGALLCVPAVAFLWNSRAGRPLLLTLLAASFLMHAPVLYGEGLAWNRLCDARPNLLWSWREPPFLHW